MKSVVEMDTPIVRREVRESPRGFLMTFGTEKIAVAGPCDGIDYGDVIVDEDSSDEDEPSMEEGNGTDTRGAKGKKEAPWQRMKWTDKVVRFLIQVVASVGEDGCLDGADVAKRKSGLIKKGKWKTVSKVLIANGFHVSPQQCEDKFNDLNKRYKKLNDILGRGISCRVVENPAMLDSLHNLSAKAKEDVRKLLTSKHLYYREMCAYHNGQKIPDCSDSELPTYSVSIAEKVWKNCDGSPVAAQSSKEEDDSPVVAQNSKGNNVSNKEAAEDNDNSSEDMMSEDEDENNACGSVETLEKYESRETINGEDRNIRSQSTRLNDFRAEMAEIFSDLTKSEWERKEWVKKRMRQLDEERIGIEVEALDIEKHRLKWKRFCNKKELELETSRLEKERLLIENEQKALQLKQKEVEVEFRRA